MKDPPDQTAPFKAENLLSATGTTVPKYFLNNSGYSFKPISVERKITVEQVKEEANESTR